MSEQSKHAMGNDKRPNVLPVNKASGPGFLGPDYSPADEMLPPAYIGVRRGGGLDEVFDAVKGVIYYSDLMGFGEPSSAFTRGMPGLRPLGVNYFMNTGLQCSNGATMWEYVETIPTGSALGVKVQNAMRDVGLPQLRGLAPGIMEDAQAALNPAPAINAVVGSGFPQCRLVRMMVGDVDGQIQNVDGKLIVDPSGLLFNYDGVSVKYYQEHWIQDRKMSVRPRPGETRRQQYLRGDAIQLDYDSWNTAPKTHRDDGCLVTPNANGSGEPSFCRQARKGGGIQVGLGDGTIVMAYPLDQSIPVATLDSFQDYRKTLVKSPHAVVSLSVAAISVIGLIAFWSMKKRT
jgi:hypothetical protein